MRVYVCHLKKLVIFTFYHPKIRTFHNVEVGVLVFDHVAQLLMEPDTEKNTPTRCFSEIFTIYAFVDKSDTQKSIGLLAGFVAKSVHPRGRNSEKRRRSNKREKRDSFRSLGGWGDVTGL